MGGLVVCYSHTDESGELVMMVEMERNEEVRNKNWYLMGF